MREMTVRRQHHLIRRTRIEGFPRRLERWRQAEYHDNAFRKEATPAGAVAVGSGQGRSKPRLGTDARHTGQLVRHSIPRPSAAPPSSASLRLGQHKHRRASARLAEGCRPHHSTEHHLHSTPARAAGRPQRAVDSQQLAGGGSGRAPRSTAPQPPPIHEERELLHAREMARRGGGSRRTARGAAPAAAHGRAPHRPPQPPLGVSTASHHALAPLAHRGRRHRGPRRRQRRQGSRPGRG